MFPPIDGTLLGSCVLALSGFGTEVDLIWGILNFLNNPWLTMPIAFVIAIVGGYMAKRSMRKFLGVYP